MSDLQLVAPAQPESTPHHSPHTVEEKQHRGPDAPSQQDARRSTRRNHRKRRALLPPGLFIDGVPPDLSPQQTFHRLAFLVPSLRRGRKTFRQLGNGGYILRHADAHAIPRDKIPPEWSLRPMIQEYARAVTFAPVGVPNQAFKQIDGLVYARRWKRKGRPQRGVSLFFDSPEALAYAVRDGAYIHQFLEILPAHPQDIDKDQREQWTCDEVARLLNSIPGQGHSTAQESQFRTRCQRARERASSHVPVQRPKSARSTKKPKSKNSAKKRKTTYAQALTRTVTDDVKAHDEPMQPATPPAPTPPQHEKVTDPAPAPTAARAFSAAPTQGSMDLDDPQRLENSIMQLHEMIQVLSNQMDQLRDQVVLLSSHQPKVNENFIECHHALKDIRERLDQVEVSVSMIDDYDNDNALVPTPSDDDEAPQNIGIRCGICQDVFKSPDDLELHLTTHQYCHTCDYQATGPEAVRKHHAEFHKPCVCPACGMHIMGEVPLHHHLTTQHPSSSNPNVNHGTGAQQ